MRKPVKTSNPTIQGPDLIELDSSVALVIISLLEPEEAQINALLTSKKPTKYSNLNGVIPQPQRSGPSPYIYNYYGGDVPIYLFAGSKLRYILLVMGTAASSCPAQLYLFKNWQVYDSFKNGHFNSFKKSSCLIPAPHNQTLIFEITISATYYVGIYIGSNTSVIGYISVEHVFYNTTEFDKQKYCSEQLSVNNPNCKVTICNVAPACSNQYYLLVNSTSNITYGIMEKHLFSNKEGQVVFLAFALLIVLIISLVLICICTCKLITRNSPSGIIKYNLNIYSHV